jgi:hypothetical protein
MNSSAHSKRLLVHEKFDLQRGTWNTRKAKLCFAKTKDVSGLGCRPLCLRQFELSIQGRDIVA